MRSAQFVSAAVAGLMITIGSVATASAQEVSVSGNVAMTSDYAFRGISQTSENVAVQGGFDFGIDPGLYIGAWGSSLNFGETDPVGRAHMELDVYGGFAPTVGPVALDVGALYYAYPGVTESYNYDFWEAYAGAGTEFGPVGVGVFGAWSPDFFAASGTGLFYSADASISVPDTPFGLDGSIGYQSIEDNGAFGTPDYTVFNVGASVGYWGLDFGIAFTGTDLEEEDCFGGSELCESRVIFSVGSSW